MSASAESCSHCGKAGVGLKRCSRCKQASYCGAACQNAGWKGHKKMCASVQEVDEHLKVAHIAGDWRGVLKWEGRMEELMARETDAYCESTLDVFSCAHRAGYDVTGSTDHARSLVGLEERRSPLLGNLQRFRDQGEAMCKMAEFLSVLERHSEASTWFQRARDVGAAHGFFSVECQACMGLGGVAMKEGRHEEGVALLRNALAAAQLNETDNPAYELGPMADLVDALFTTDAIDDAEPLVLRYREAAKAQSEKGGFDFADVRSLFFTARLHEAHGRPEEAAREVRAMIDVMCENEAVVQRFAAGCGVLLQLASTNFWILDPEVGDKELIQAVAVQLAKLRL